MKPWNGLSIKVLRLWIAEPLAAGGRVLVEDVFGLISGYLNVEEASLSAAVDSTLPVSFWGEGMLRLAVG